MNRTFLRSKKKGKYQIYVNFLRRFQIYVTYNQSIVVHQIYVTIMRLYEIICKNVNIYYRYMSLHRHSFSFMHTSFRSMLLAILYQNIHDLAISNIARSQEYCIIHFNLRKILKYTVHGTVML